MALFMAPDGSVYEAPRKTMEAFRVSRDTSGADSLDPDAEEEAGMRVSDRSLSELEIEEVEAALRQFARMLGDA